MKTEKWSDWKLDKSQIVHTLLWAIMTYLVFPLVPFAIMQDLKIPLEANTFFAVFVTLFAIRICRFLNHLPRYRTLLQEKVVS